jgi:HSP20 family protein
MTNLIPWRRKQQASEEAENFPMTTLRQEMDRLFDTFLRDPFAEMDFPWMKRSQFVPAVDVSEQDDEVCVRAEIPGIDPKDLDVSITGNQLVLSGEKKESKETKEKGYFHSETHYGAFHRTVPLPEGVDSQQVDAHYADGVLTLKIKKRPDFAPKKIHVAVKK